MYESYAKFNEVATSLLQTINDPSNSKFDRFREFQNKALQDPRCKGLNLASLLITPVQRLPRYRMLLAELIKATPASHPDAAKLPEVRARRADATSRAQLLRER